MTTQEKNVAISEWLGWKFIETIYYAWYDNKGNKICFEDSELKFDTDSNWQWECLEKIAKDIDSTISYAIDFLHEFMDFYQTEETKVINFENGWNINSKADLFEAIYKYTQKGKEYLELSM